MRPVTHIRRDVLDVREKIEAIQAKMHDGSETDADIQEFDALMPRFKALIAEQETASLKEAAVAAERQKLNAVFNGGTPSTPTGDGSRGYSAKAGSGFAAAVMGAGFDLRTNPAVTVNMAEAYGVEMKASVDLSGTTPSTYRPLRIAEIQALGRDARFLWPYLRSQGVGDETAIEDFVQTGSRTITGSVERAVAAVTAKATLDVSLDHVVTQLKTLAVVMDEIPVQVLRSIAGIEQFLNAEARFALDQALDAHVLAQILAANPPNAATGANIFEHIRNGIAAMRLLGSSPDLLVLNPTDSAEMDLLQDNEGRYYFGGPNQTEGPVLWGLRVVEHSTPAGTQAPILIDSARLGVLYLGLMRFEADPYTGFKNNLVDLRMEGNALQHIRDANAAYIIEA